MVMEIYTGLALLATLKTLARFKQLENRAISSRERFSASFSGAILELSCVVPPAPNQP